MSEIYRTPTEYAKLYALQHHMTVEEAIQTKMVKEFARTRGGTDENDNGIDRGLSREDVQ